MNSKKFCPESPLIIAQTSALSLKTPDSILSDSGTNYSDLLSEFAALPPSQQTQFLQQLPQCLSINQLTILKSSIDPLFKCDFIKNLPTELALYVLGFLDLKTLAVVSQVSKTWRHLIENDILIWENMAKLTKNPSFPSNFPPFLSDRPIKSYHVELEPSRLSSTSAKIKYYKEFSRRNFLLNDNWMAGKFTKEITVPAHGAHVITCLLIANDSIITGSDDSLIKIWDIETGALKKILIGHIGGVWSLESSDKFLISGATDRTLRIWDMDSGRTIHELLGHTSTVRCLTIFRDKIISGSRDATIRIWNLHTGESIKTLTGHTGSVRCIDICDYFIVSGSYDNTCRVWNVETGECLYELIGHTHRIYSIACSSKYIISGSQDNTARIWDVNTGKCLHELKLHRLLVSTVSIFGSLAFTASSDGTVCVCSLETGKLITRFESTASMISSLQADSKKLVCCADKFVKLYDLKSGMLISNIVNDVDFTWRNVHNENTLAVACQINGSSYLRILGFEPL